MLELKYHLIIFSEYNKEDSLQIIINIVITELLKKKW